MYYNMRVRAASLAFSIHDGAEAQKTYVTFSVQLGGYCSLNKVSYCYVSQEKPPLAFFAGDSGVLRHSTVL